MKFCHILKSIKIFNSYYIFIKSSFFLCFYICKYFRINMLHLFFIFRNLTHIIYLVFWIATIAVLRYKSNEA